MRRMYQPRKSLFRISMFQTYSGITPEEFQYRKVCLNAVHPAIPLSLSHSLSPSIALSPSLGIYAAFIFHAVGSSWRSCKVKAKTQSANGRQCVTRLTTFYIPGEQACRVQAILGAQACPQKLHLLQPATYPAFIFHAVGSSWKSCKVKAKTP